MMVVGFDDDMVIVLIVAKVLDDERLKIVT